MRVISGELGGRQFHPPADNWPTRPTTEIAREALYNTLSFDLDFEAVHFLDLFGGTGAHTYECISRGCPKVTYVDKHQPCVDFVAKTLEEFEIEDKVTVIRADVINFMKFHDKTYQFIFAGPPYGWKHMADIPDMIFNTDLLDKEAGVFVLEHNQHHHYKGHPYFVFEKNYGQTHLSFFTWNAAS